MVSLRVKALWLPSIPSDQQEAVCLSNLSVVTAQSFRMAASLEMRLALVLAPGNLEGVPFYATRPFGCKRAGNGTCPKN